MSSTGTGTQQGAGLDGQRWEEEPCTPPTPQGISDVDTIQSV